MRVEVTEFSPLAHKTLAESTRENYQATVFVITKEKDIVESKVRAAAAWRHPGPYNAYRAVGGGCQIVKK